MILGMRGPSDVRRWKPGDPAGVPPLLLDPKGRWPNVAVSPRGNVLAVATGADNTGWPEGTTKLYDPITGAERHALPESGGFISFSPDGKLLATGSWAGLIKLWNPETGTLVGTLKDAPRVVALDFSSDSLSLVVCSNTRGVLIYDLATGAARSMARGHTSAVWGARISPDGKLLATASGDQSVRIWEMETGRQKAELRGHSYSVGKVAWSPDGKILASGGQDALRLWKVDEAAVVEPPMTGMVRRSFFAPNGRLLAVARPDGNVTLHEFPSLNVVTGPKLIGKPIRYVDGGKILVTLQQQGNGPAKVLRWSVPELESISAIEVPESNTPLVEPVIAPGGRFLAAGVGPSLIGMWDLEKGVLVAKFGGAIPGVGRIRTLGFSPNGRQLAGSFHDWPVVLIWDFSNEKPTRLATERHLGHVAQLVFSADGNTLVTGDTDKFIKIWDVATAKEKATLLGHRSGIASVDISPDGRTVASSSDDGSVRLWNVATRREVARFDGHGVMNQVTFSPDGSALLLTIRGATDRPPTTLVWRAPPLNVADERK
jgi:WD40 repeat protein